jgi:hypothetical protein
LNNKDKDKTSSTAAEMNFIQQMTKYTWMDPKQREYILQELRMEPTPDKILEHRVSCIRSFSMDLGKTTALKGKLRTREM